MPSDRQRCSMFQPLSLPQLSPPARKAATSRSVKRSNHHAHHARATIACGVSPSGQVHGDRLARAGTDHQSATAALAAREARQVATLTISSMAGMLLVQGEEYPSPPSWPAFSRQASTAPSSARSSAPRTRPLGTRSRSPTTPPGPPGPVPVPPPSSTSSSTSQLARPRWRCYGGSLVHGVDVAHGGEGGVNLPHVVGDGCSVRPMRGCGAACPVSPFWLQCRMGHARRRRARS